MGWKTPYLMIQKGNFFGVQAISAPILRNFSLRPDVWSVCFNSKNGHHSKKI